MNKQTERLISATKLLEYINGSPLGYANDNFIESLELKINIGEFDPDPIPLPTLKPGDTRQLLHNTIDVMTDKQVRILARTIGLDPIKEVQEDVR